MFLSLSLSLPRTVRDSKLPLNLHFFLSDFCLHTRFRTTSFTIITSFTYICHKSHPSTTTCDDEPLVGHFGGVKTLALLSRGFWWPQPWKLVKEFIKTCDVCARSKAAHHRPYIWASLSMDFIIELPQVGDHDTVVVAVDRFSKIAHFVPCSKTISGEDRTDLVLKNVVQLHGFPEDATSDRGPQFISHF